jgi:3-(3-hydroxy-phenyl)propionate hydroxylase
LDSRPPFLPANALVTPTTTSPAPQDVVRQRVYVFHTLLAREWRRGRVCLLGDSAHMMPPFAGQGLNAGLRDANNLAWKLAGVIRGELGSEVLDSYEQEQRPQAEAVTALSLRRGKAIMTTNRASAYSRDAAVAVASCIPALRRRLDDLPLKPSPRFETGLVINLDGSYDDVTGRMLPQPRVLLSNSRKVLLDELFGPSFALLAIEPAADVVESLRSPLWTTLKVKVVRLAIEPVFPCQLPAQPLAVADADGLLEDFFHRERGCGVLVRPDRVIIGAFRPAQEAQFTSTLATRIFNSSLAVPAGPN